MPTSPTHLSPLDLTLVALYLVAITLFGLQFRNKSKDKSLKNYFLANNTIPWWAIALSIVSAETSTLTIISIPGVAFAGDFGFLQVVLGYMIGRIVVALLFLPRYFRGEMLTAYQLIDQRFGTTLYKLTAGLFLLTRAAAEGVRVFAISIVVGIAIGTGDTLSIFIISALTLLYTFEGGMAAVIWTDVVQMTLYVAGTVVAIFTLGLHVPGGWSHIHAVAAPLGKFHWLDFSFNLTKSYTFWAGVLGGSFLTMASHGTDQLMVQRMLAARNLRESRLALLSSGAVIFLQFTLFLLIGVGLYVFYGLHPQAFTSSDRIFPTFIVHEMPHGVSGLLVAAILAAAMSNLSAALNSLASTTVIDFIVPFRKSRTKNVLGAPPFPEPHPGKGGVSGNARPHSPNPPHPPDNTLISRLATVFWAIVLFAIAVYAIQHGGKGHVVETGLSIASVAYGCLLGVFLLGTLTRYATQLGAIIGMITGLAVNLFLYQATFPQPFIPLSLHIAFTWYVLIGALTTFAIGTVASLTLPKPRTTLAALLLLTTVSFGTIPCLSFRTEAQSVPHSSQSHRDEWVPTTKTPVILSEARSAQPKDPDTLRPPDTARSTPTPSSVPHLRPATTRQASLIAAAPSAANASRYPEASASGLSSPSQETGLQPRGYDFTPIDTLITSAIAAHQLPGAVVVIGHNHHIVYKKSYGLRKLSGEPGPSGQPTPAEPMTEDTLFDMASLSKVLSTTTAILQLYEQGKLDLDTPVTHYLPQFAETKQPLTEVGAPSFAPSAKGGVSSEPGSPAGRTLPAGVVEARPPSSSEPTMSRAPFIAQPHRAMSGSTQENPEAPAWKSRITIRQLLTHYSGLPEDVSLKDDWGLEAPDKAEGIRRAMTAVPYGPPGTIFKYSDINFITLGYLVETLSGQSLDTYARDHIFAPLGMTATRYLPFDQACGPTQRIGAAIALPADTPLPALGRQPIAAGPPAFSCPPPDHWIPLAVIPSTAPTAHDDQLTPYLNPDFNNLLRGTVHDPTTRRMGGVAGHAGVFSTAADAAIFCQALLNKLLNNEGPFPLKQSTLREATSPQAPATALASATIFTADGQPTKGVAERGLGWDINSAFSRPRGELFPIATGGYGKPGHPGSFGHTGYTGTTLWLDPTSNTYLVLLSNAVHPRVTPNISPLRGQVATAVARALRLQTSTQQTCPPNTLCDWVEMTSSKGGVDPPRTALPVLGAPSFAESHPGKGGVSSEARPPSSTSAPNPGARGLASETSISNPSTTSSTAPTTAKTLTGIDVLEQTNFAALKSLPHKSPLRIALVTNQNGLDRQSRRTIDILLHASPDILLTTLFSPEHGLYGKQDTEQLSTEQDPTTHLPVISLYGSKPADKHPKASDLANLDAVVIDLQDIGVRFWTYEALVGYFLEAGACNSHLQIVVLDRPNPIGGLAVQGPVSDPQQDVYTNYLPLPVRHGMTLGELARYYDQNHVVSCPASTTQTSTPNHAKLTVVPMQNWTRNQFFEDTQLPWTPPSPNMRTPTAAILYPGVGLTEQTNLSVGRGTSTPFENLGAPWLNPSEIITYLDSRNIPGIHLTPTTMIIAEDSNHYPSHGQTIPGLHFEVTDRTAFDSPQFGLELLAALHHLYPAEFHLNGAKSLIANAQILSALTAGIDPRTIQKQSTPTLEAFKQRRQPALLYP